MPSQKELLTSADKTKLAGSAANSHSPYMKTVNSFLSASLVFTRNDGSVLQANENACQLFGYSAEAFKTLHLSELLNETGSSINPVLEEIKRDGSTRGEIMAKRKNGEPFNCAFSSIIFNDEDGKENVILQLADISPASKYQQELLRSAELLLQAEITGQTGSWELDISTGHLNLSQGFFKIINYEPGTFVADINFLQETLIFWDDRTKFETLHKKLLKTGDPYEAEIRLVKPGGEIRTVIIKAELVPGTEKAGQANGIIRDITENKKALDQLIINEKRYRSLVENGSDAIAILTPEGNPIYISSSIKNVLGYSPEEAMKLDLFSITHPDDLENVAITWQKALDLPGVPMRGYTSRMLHKDGSWRWMEDTVVNMLHDPDTNGMVDNFRDVTEKVNAANELLRRQQLVEQAESNYREIFDKANDGILIVDMANGSLLDLNEKACEILGGSKEDFLMVNQDLFVTGRPGFTADVRDGYINKCLTEGPQLFDWMVLQKNGNFTWIEVSLTKANIGDNERILVFIRDINNRKLSDLRLLESEVHLAEAQQLAKVGNWNLDIANDKLTWSQELDRIFGTDQQNFDGKLASFLAKIDVADRERVQQAILKTEHDGIPYSVEYSIPKKDREKLIIQQLGYGQQDENGKVVRLFGTAQDITERRRTEEEREFDRKDKEALINTTEDLMWSVDKNLRLIVANNAFNTHICMATGIVINPGESILNTAIYPGEYILIWENLYNRAFNAESFKTELFLPKMNNRQEKWVEISLKPIQTSKEVVGIACYLRDITENRQYQNELLRINHKLKTAQQIAHLGYWELSLDTKKLYWSHEVYAIWGVDDAFELDEDNFYNTIHQDDKEFLKITQQLALAGNGLDVEYRIILPDGGIKYVHEKGSMIRDENGLPVKMEGTVQDITERKNAERSGEELKKRFEAIFNEANDAILLANDEQFYIQVNPAASHMLGYTAEELLQLSGPDIIVRLINKGDVADNWDAFKKNRKQSGIVELKRKDGQVIICHYNAVADILPGLHLSILTDITEREQSRREIEQQKKNIHTILDSITDGFYSVNKNWEFTYWNRAAENMLQNKKENVIGKNLWELFPETLNLKNYQEFHRAMEQNTSVRFDEYFSFLNLWLEVSVYPAEDGLSVYFQDITERIKSQEATRISNERYDMVAKATNDSVWDWDLQTNEVIRPGNNLETSFGHKATLSTDVDVFWSRHVHPEDWASLSAKRSAIFENPKENFWEDEYRFLKADGQYGYVYDRGHILRNNEGKAIRMIGASQDITRNKEQVNEIIRTKQNLDSLINTTSDLVWSINIDLEVITANKAFNQLIEQITGKPVQEGDFITDIPGSGINADWRSYYRRALSGESFDFELPYYNPLANEVWHTINTLSPIRDNEGNISGVACYSKNVTELKKTGQKLEELNSVLEKRAEELAISNSDLEQFAYVASHDLQEPLRMISSFLLLLQKKYKDSLDETAAKYIHFSVDGAERMKRLINDLLQFSRIGTVSLEMVAVDMNKIVQGTLSLYKNELHAGDIDIIVHDLPVIMTGESAMSQLMQNLLSNAFKYRNKEKTIVTVSAREEPGEWIFTVEDNGIGIDRKFSDKIFVIFQRLHNKDEYSGTGIGLAICKKIVDRYGGRIWVESIIDKGSKFIFAIPKTLKD